MVEGSPRISSGTGFHPVPLFNSDEVAIMGQVSGPPLPHHLEPVGRSTEGESK